MRRKRWLWALGILAVLGGVLFYYDSRSAGYFLTDYRILIRATFVDDETGLPVRAARALTIPFREYLEDSSWIEQQLEYHATEPEWWQLGISALGTSEADGALEMSLMAKWCYGVSSLEYALGVEKEAPPFYATEALLVESADYETLVVDCTKGEWTRHDREARDGPRATLELGEIRLTPKK